LHSFLVRGRQRRRKIGVIASLIIWHMPCRDRLSNREKPNRCFSIVAHAALDHLPSRKAAPQMIPSQSQDVAMILNTGELRALIEAAPDAIIVINRAGTIVLVNHQAEVIFGYERSEMLQQPLDLLLPERYRAAHKLARTHYIAHPHTRPMGTGLDLYGKHKNGREIPVEISLSPLTIQQETLYVSSVRDITERKRLEHEFRSLLEATPDAMIIINESGQIVLVNHQAEVIFGYERAELLEHPIEMLLPERFRAVHPFHRVNYFAQPHVRPMGTGLELYARRKDGSEFPVEISLSPLITNEKKLVISSIRDITDRKLLDSLRETNRRMDAFLSVASHELKTPLTFLKASIQLTQRRWKSMMANAPFPVDAEKTQDMLDHLMNADHQINRLERLVDDILEVSRLQSDTITYAMHPIRLDTLVREVYEDYRMNHPDHIFTLNFREQEPVPVLVLGDDDRIRQVLSNYLTNAMKYADAIHPIKIEFANEGRQARVSVSDSGPGLAVEDQEHIWERFYRVDRTKVINGSGVGLGLGLYISKMIVLHHGGEVGVHSISGEGSTFWFTLPVLTGTS
jgi:PAS domain S-box-containing protein